MHPDAPGAAIPRFFLYGDAGTVADAEFFHIEDIRSRSERYDWEIGTHTHPGLYQVVFFLDGGGELTLDGRRSAVTAPLAAAIPPGVVHAFRFTPGTHGYVLTLTAAMLSGEAGNAGRMFEDVLFRQPQVIPLESAAPMAALLEQLQAEFHEDAAGRAKMVEWLVCALLMLLARSRPQAADAATPADRARHELFARFRALVEAHYAEHWLVPRYAEALHTTESTLNRLCQAVAGRSAFELTQDRLLLEARRKLIYIAAPVSRIAYELGFQDPAYFCRFFRRRTGLTPSAFRRQGMEGEG